MTRTSMAVTAALATLIMIAVALAVGSRLPADALLPTHWGLDGHPDAYSGKWVALFLPPAVTAATSLLFYFLPALEPRKEGLERSQGLYLWGWMAMLLMGGIIDLAVVSVALGWDVPADRLVIGGVGLVLVLVGNQLGKSRSMYMIGIRTPWTLASEEVWIKTHRLGGKLMVASGLATVAAALLPIPPLLLALAPIGTVIVAAVVPIAYSFLLWRRIRPADSAR